MKHGRSFVTNLLFVIGLLLTYQGQARWTHTKITLSHNFSPAVHAQLSESIKATILKKLSLFKNPQWVAQFQQDLREPNKSKRTLSEISPTNAAILFQLFGIKDPHCDHNLDGVIREKELKCLNKIWKYYVPAG